MNQTMKELECEKWTSLTFVERHKFKWFGFIYTPNTENDPAPCNPMVSSDRATRVGP